MQRAEMYQSCCDVGFDPILRGAAESLSVNIKIQLENNNHTSETNDCNLDNTFCGVQEGQSEITKERKEKKNSLSEI